LLHNTLFRNKMKRKATFSPKKPKQNSSDHNSRKEIPKYLIETDPDFDLNFYERITPYDNDDQFVSLAKKIYKEKFIERTGQKQSMQKKQAEALISEVVITIDEHHTKKDILDLFSMLKREKAQGNALKANLVNNRLKPLPKLQQYVLPSKLKIKRKPKKENLNETGYHILELAGHYDEGHFIRKGKWENLAYYPSKHILLKEDGNWYIKSDELDEHTDKDTFDHLADMNEFEKVYNLHWHVKYTDFNLETGLTASFSKGEISGEGRLKKVAEHLDLRYVPEEKIPLEQGVRSIKEQHHRNRQEKYQRLIMKFDFDLKHQQQVEKTKNREVFLAERITRERNEKKLNNELLESIEKLSSRIKTLEDELELKTNEIDIIQSLYNDNKEQSLTYEKTSLEQTEKIRLLEELIKKNHEDIQGKDTSIKELIDKGAEKDVQVQRQLEEIESLTKDVYSPKWTQTSQTTGVRYKSKNVDVVKHLEKVTEEYKNEIEVLKTEKEKKEIQIAKFEQLIYTGLKYPIELGENDEPIEFEKETWKEVAEYQIKENEQLMMENDYLSQENDELNALAYYDDIRFDSELLDVVPVKVSYKSENERLMKNLKISKEIITFLGEYDVPKSALAGSLYELQENILEKEWPKKKTTILNEKVQSENKNSVFSRNKI